MSQGAPDFFVAGGAMSREARSYVERRADNDLYESLRRGEFCYVLTSRQMGKTSLLVRTAARLRDAGVMVVILDLTTIGQNLTVEQWYYGLLGLVGQQLGLRRELRELWLADPLVGPMQRWLSAIQGLVLDRSPGGLAIFVDEIDSVLSLSFRTDEFFAGIRESFNRRPEDPRLQRLAFCLMGVASPSDLIQDPRTTPFNIGRRIELNDFTEAEAAPLAGGLESRSGNQLPPAAAAQLLRRVLYWTHGHPFLTQRLCRAVSEHLQTSSRPGPHARIVDRLCAELFLSPSAREHDDNLLFVQKRLLEGGHDWVGVLHLYREIRHGRPLADDETNPAVMVLRLSGIVRSVYGRLTPRNRIYTRVFTRRWIEARMPDAELRRQREAYLRGIRRTAVVFTTVMGVIGSLTAYALYSGAEARRLNTVAAHLAVERGEIQYTSQIQATWQAVRSGNYNRARLLLDELARPPLRDYAGQWEMSYLWGMCHQDRMPSYRHSGPVQLVKFLKHPKYSEVSSDSQMLISIGVDHQRITSVDGAVVETTNTASDSKRKVSISADGRRVLEVTGLGDLVPASGGGGWLRAKLIDLEQNRSTTVPGIPPDVRNLLLAPNGRRIAGLVGSRGHREVRVWTETGKPVPLESQWSATTFAFCEDTGRLMVGIADGTLAEVDLETGKIRQRWRLGTGELGFLTISRTGRLAAFSPAEGQVCVWDLRRNSRLMDLPPVPGSLYGLEISPDERDLAVSAYQPRALRQPGLLAVYSLNDPTKVLELKGHTGMVTALAFSADSQVLATGGIDAHVRQWDLRQLPTTSSFKTRGPVFRVHFARDGGRLGTVGPDAYRLWNLASQGCLAEVSGLFNLRYDFSSELRMLAVGNGLTVILRNLENRNPARRLKHPAPISAVAFAPDGSVLFTAATDRTIRVWNIASGELSRQYPAGSEVPIALRVTADGRHFVYLGRAGALSLRDVESGQERANIRIPGTATRTLAISPDGLRVAVGDDRGVWLWDVPANRLDQLPGARVRIRSMSFSPDGKTLACGSLDSEVYLWNVAARQVIGTLDGCPSGNWGVAFSADGQTLAAGGADSLVRFWRGSNTSPR